MPASKTYGWNTVGNVGIWWLPTWFDNAPDPACGEVLTIWKDIYPLWISVVNYHSYTIVTEFTILKYLE
jgi:hypothetical protein